MANIKQIKLPQVATPYDIVDQGARDLIAGLSGSTQYLGVTTTQLVDNVTTNPSITVGGKTVTASAGGIATYQSKEFIYNGSVWQEFGDLSALGDLAYKDTASGPITPAGSVSQPTFTGNELTSTGKFTPHGSVSVGTSSAKHPVSPAASGTATYTPAGSVALTNTGKSTTVSKAASGTATYTPEGSVAFTTGAEPVAITREDGDESDHMLKEVTTARAELDVQTPTITLAAGSAGNGHQVTGTVSTPTITVTPSTTTVNSITAVGSLPAWTATVDNEILTFSWNEGTLPTKGDNTTVATGIQSATSTQPTFTGGYVRATSSSVNGASGAVELTYDYINLTANDVIVPKSASFTGTGARLVTGSIDVPTSASFTGTGVHLETDNITSPNGTNSFSGTEETVTVKGTPSGTVSKPTFTGTEGTVTVS